MLQLIEYIKNNPNWETDLSNSPYYIKIKRENNFIMFNYNQLSSDFYNPIVKECRGLILDINYNPVCVPFYKFGNYGEGYADQIDWNSARVQEKIDGSLIKVWNYKGEWHISTNGMIDATNAILEENGVNFKELFLTAATRSNLWIHNLNPQFTYMFELTSPYNKVVISYDSISIRHIGTRNIETLQECDINIGVAKPSQYDLHSLEDCIKATSQMPFSEEGYVVVDKNWHRIKIKSPAYVAVHRLKNNGVITEEKIVDLILINEDEEFLVYYPEYKKMFDDVKLNFNTFVENMDGEILASTKKIFYSRKDFAEFAKQTKCPALMFNWYDNKCKNAKDWIDKQSSDKIVKWLYGR